MVLALTSAGPSAPPAPLPDGEPTRWSPYGFRLAGGDPAPLVASGQAAVQDEASQLAALALTRIGVPGQDKLWLDLCAGPGGKARLLGGLAAGRGARLVAADIHPHRARRVLDALNRSGGENHGVIAADGRQAPWPPGTFDRVLADVPCSGLGSLRRRPEARWRKTPGDLAELASLQRQLLGTALDSVRPGGVVAYVTCSPHLAETRDVVTAVVQDREESLGEPERPEEIGLESMPRSLGPAALAVDPRVDESIEDGSRLVATSARGRRSSRDSRWPKSVKSTTFTEPASPLGVSLSSGVTRSTRESGKMEA